MTAHKPKKDHPWRAKYVGRQKKECPYKLEPRKGSMKIEEIIEIASIEEEYFNDGAEEKEERIKELIQSLLNEQLKGLEKKMIARSRKGNKDLSGDEYTQTIRNAYLMGAGDMKDVLREEK